MQLTGASIDAKTLVGPDSLERHSALQRLVNSGEHFTHATFPNWLRER